MTLTWVPSAVWAARIIYERSPMMSHHMSTLRDTNVSTADKAAQADALREPMIAELREMTAR